MTTKTYTTRASYAFSVLAFAAACGLTACAPEDEGDPYVAPDGGFTAADSAVVAAPDAGTVVATPADTGVAAPFDAGVTNPIPKVDSGVVGNDAGPVVTAEAGTPDGGGTDTRPDKGMGDGKDVITIGDSWMNLDNSVGIQQSLEKASKRDYRNFGAPGTKLLDEVIPKQFTTAKMQGPVKTVIMTGGGNDVLQDPLLLLGACPDGTFNADCKKRIDDVAARLQKLWAQMAADGVEDVLIISYSNLTLAGGYKMVTAYSTEKINPICASVPAPLRCSTFDTDMNVMFKDRGDAIHPDNATYDALGVGIWKLMQEKGMRR